MGYDDPNDPGNGLQYHTGKKCIEPGCDKPAGTAWGPSRCFEHNVERINRIEKEWQILIDRMGKANLT
jgi:hypothetical protein